MAEVKNRRSAATQVCITLLTAEKKKSSSHKHPISDSQSMRAGCGCAIWQGICGKEITDNAGVSALRGLGTWSAVTLRSTVYCVQASQTCLPVVCSRALMVP